MDKKLLSKPTFPDNKIIKLRLDLIKEELNELEDAIKNKNLVEIADALTDILCNLWSWTCFWH